MLTSKVDPWKDEILTSATLIVCIFENTSLTVSTFRPFETTCRLHFNYDLFWIKNTRNSMIVCRIVATFR